MEQLVLLEKDPMDPAEAGRLAAWLDANGPDQWHELVRRWNFDFGIHPLAWIVQQPDCDRATAQEIFFHLCGWLSLWDSARKAGRHFTTNDEVRLLDYVIARWQAEGFQRSELASTHQTHEWGLTNLRAIPYGYPDSLLDRIAGRSAEALAWGEEMPAGVETPP